jgi:hypothetical protein
MPNWCENSLTVSGPQQDIRRFQQLARPTRDGQQGDLSLARLYPMPPGTLRGDLDVKTLAEQGDQTWYHWCIGHWGTKWDIEARLIAESPTCLEYAFASAWNPPVAWLVKVGADFPTLRFKLVYEEPDMGFSGVTVVDRGWVLVDQCQRYA